MNYFQQSLVSEDKKPIKLKYEIENIRYIIRVKTTSKHNNLQS